MGLKKMIHSYYGRIDDEIPIRPLADDILKESECNMMQLMKDMEDRLKRHITECKRDVIKELILLTHAIEINKDIKNVRCSKTKS